MISSIGRLHAHLRSPQPVERARYADWLGQLAGLDDIAPASATLADDEWVLIRHLPLALDWQLDASEAEIGARWQSALHAAINHALSRDDDTVVRYRSRQAALADLLYRSALGDDNRQWAWQQMGLVPRAPLASGDALLQGARSLLSEPVLIWPVLHRLIAAETRSAALSAVLRALPQAQWTTLLLSCPQTADFARAAMADPADAVTPGMAAPPADPASAPSPASPAALSLLDWAQRRPDLVLVHRDTLAVLLATLSSSAAQHSTRTAICFINAARRALQAPQPTPAPRAPTATGPTSTPPPLPEQAHEPLPTQPPLVDDLIPPPPELPDTGCDLPTAQAGLLFWLGQISTGQPALEDLPPLDDALPLWLRALGRALGCDDGDVALRAFCGGELPHGADTPPDIDALAQATASRWAAWVDALAPDLPAPRLQHICRRPGTLHIEPGWIELRLSLDQVETPIRRLGLDLDPGWLPWLGCVVKVRYEG